MDHKELLTSMDVKNRAELTKKSDKAGLKHLAAHLGWILVIGCYIAVGAPFWGVLLVPQGILLVFLFTLLHETVHFTPFKQRWLNLLVGHLCSVVIVVPNQWFRYFHLAHHKHTNDPNHDPELAQAKPQTVWEYAKHISGLPYWRAQIGVLIDQARGRVAASFLPERAEKICMWQARAMIGIYGCALVLMVSGVEWLFWCWAVPLLLGQPFLRLYLLAEHGLCPPVANMFENTRTTFTHKIVRFLAWNMPYHAEHHAYPAVPFHNLPKFHKIVREQLVTTSNGYKSFHKDYLSSVRN